MVNKTKSKINIHRRKAILKNHPKLLKKAHRNYSKFRRIAKIESIHSKFRFNKFTRIFSILTGVAFIFTVLFVFISMQYIQFVTDNLPTPDKPFQEKQQSSIVYSANIDPSTKENVELYRLFDEENRVSLKINEVPDHVKWAFLAAEDIDFYEHKGFDIPGIAKAFMFEFFNVGAQRGGSTITQQLIKQTTLGDERSFDRKLKELLLSIEVERKYPKDQILEMYLNVSNFGGNIYGLKTAAKFYFNKDINELTLAEAAVLARIPQNPVHNSPTISADKEAGAKRAIAGMNYVLDQMSNNIDKINDHIPNSDNIIVQSEIDAARIEKLTYQKAKIDIKAPHFVFYIEKILTQRAYNKGKPFTTKEIREGGYKIYTSLDVDVQKIAEEEVLNGVNNISFRRNGFNGAAIITRPSTGDIVAMVGSKGYGYADYGRLFNGMFNVTSSLQSMGSSMKPFGYYKAFEMGVASPGSYIPDAPIKMGNYAPKNWDGKFNGTATARKQLSDSRNLPAIFIVNQIGLDNYLNTLTQFGFDTVAQNRSTYGPSLILGGGEVTMVEHAQAYGVFSNGGDLVKLNPILKITKINPKTNTEEIIYERKIEPTRVADPRAIFMVNHILNYKNGGPGQYIDGRDFAGKTGTTEMHKDTVYAGYTPDFVIIGWNGNNDNTPMIANSWGENVTKPWVVNLAKRIGGYFPEKRAFSRPPGITSTRGDLIYEGRSIKDYGKKEEDKDKKQ